MSSSSAGGRSHFADLPTDIKSMIIRYIIRPTDLVSVCLTCKQLHEIAVRFLYHTIILDLGSDADKLIPAMLSPLNKGVKYIKNIELYRTADPLDSNGVMRQADLAMRMMLEFLPQNQLERWSFHPWSSFSVDNMKLLYRKQKRMKWLEAIALDSAVCQCLLHSFDLDSVSQNVTKLGLYPDSPDTLKFCNELLRRANKVTKITLHTNFDEELDAHIIPATELNDTPTQYGRLTREIFSHMIPFENCSPLCLTDLTLQRVHLRYANKSFCKAIDFRVMKNLRIFECAGADALLAALCESYRLPNSLNTFEFKHDDDGKDCESTVAAEGFLCLVSGVQRLTLDIGNTKNLPNEKCILRHRSSLQILNVHASPVRSSDSDDEDEWVYEADVFDKICKNCRLLEELCVAFPRTPIARQPSDDFTAFANSVRWLGQLVTLNITTWPTSISNSSRMPRKLYEHLLQGIAQSFFESSAAGVPVGFLFSGWSAATALLNAASPPPVPEPGEFIFPPGGAGHTSILPLDTPAQDRLLIPLPGKLNLVAFGSSDRIHERKDSKDIVIFVRGKQVDPLGRGESVLAVPIGWCLRKFAEPRSEVLDFGLMRTTRPPVMRDQTGSDDGDW